MDELTRLLLDARDGDRFSLAAVVRATQRDVWRLATHLVGPGEADDVTQDVYLRMWRTLPRFRGESSARTWILVIARRACIDAIRRQARYRRFMHTPLGTGHSGFDDDPTGPAMPTAPDERVALDALVASLERDRRVAFVLTQVVGCSYQETAAICGVPVGTVRSRVARARQDLVTALHAVAAI